jgi:hypothetical protein
MSPITIHIISTTFPTISSFAGPVTKKMHSGAPLFDYLCQTQLGHEENDAHYLPALIHPGRRFMPRLYTRRSLIMLDFLCRLYSGWGPGFSSGDHKLAIVHFDLSTILENQA